jgi:hypothetical protein
MCRSFINDFTSVLIFIEHTTCVLIRADYNYMVERRRSFYQLIKRQLKTFTVTLNVFSEYLCLVDKHFGNGAFFFPVTNQ